MTLTRPCLLKLVLPVLVFAAVLAVLALVNRSPSIAPDRDASAAEPATLPGDTDSRISTLQRAVRTAPGRAQGYALLGETYLQKARESGDPSYYTRADRAYGAALRRDAGNL